MITKCNHTAFLEICSDCLKENEIEQLRKRVAELEEHRKNGVSALPVEPDPEEMIEIDGRLQTRLEWERIIEYRHKQAYQHTTSADRITAALEGEK